VILKVVGSNPANRPFFISFIIKTSDFSFTSKTTYTIFFSCMIITYKRTTK